jgi:signal transduction histidine kinase
MDGSAVILEKGPLFPLFGLYMVITVGLSLYKILTVYRNSRGNSKKQAGLVLIGLLGCAANSLVVGVLLPMAGIYSFVNLDSPSFIIFIVLACIAILKYQFLDIKVIMAELMVVLLITLSIVDMMYYQSQTELIVKIFFSFILVAMGIFLVKSVHSEVLRKEELEIANAKLMELDKSKSEFISIASHQLRTPLTSMKGFISIMKNGSYGKLPRKLEEPINHIETANERLISLVKNMLDISRIEAGGMAFEFKKENPEALLEELYQSFLPIAQEKDVSMEIEIQKGLPKIKMDYAKVRELISNIIDNAIKYTESGNIKIALKKKKDTVQIAVSDTGIGISEKELKGLFDKFFRGKKARQLKKNGSGLGLYLGKKIAEAHGGKIYARSKGSSKGSTFFVELPLE